MCGIALVVEPLARRHASLAASTAPQPCTPPAREPPPSSRDTAACTVSAAFHEDLQRRLCQRGPDHFQSLQREFPAVSSDTHGLDGWHLTMHSAVLHLRGRALCRQPVVDSASNVLCWNGEVFDWLDDPDNPQDDQDEISRELLEGSDTDFLSQRLQLAGEQLETTRCAREDPVIRVLRRIRGPFAIAWLHASSQRIYFAHDRFGRRSLLYTQHNGGRTLNLLEQLAARATETQSTDVAAMTFTHSDLGSFVLSSVAVRGDSENPLVYQEVPASGIYVLDLRAKPPRAPGARQGVSDAACRLEFHPYKPLKSVAPATPPGPTKVVQDRFSCQLPRPTVDLEASNADVSVAEDAGRLLAALSSAVGLRVRSIPAPAAASETSLPKPPARLGVLFSGGLDSVVLAALTHFHLPSEEPVDLLTVCFDASSSFQSPDRQAAELAHTELCELFPSRRWRLVRVNVSRSELLQQQDEVLALLTPCETHMDFNIGAAFWFLSRGLGVVQEDGLQPGNASMESLNAFLEPRHVQLRELETAIASLELFNAPASSRGGSEALLCPVTHCGRKRKRGCVFGVCRSCCFKVQRATDKLAKSVRTSHSMDPRALQNVRLKLLDTGIQSEAHLDRLLAALKSHNEQSADQASLKPTPTPTPPVCRVHRSKHSEPLPAPVAAPVTPMAPTSEYRCTARVLLVGLGADEQLAGYGRHRTALLAGGEAALRSELHRDLARIWKRNLGRDDRCLAAHGREARFPFLDEAVVATIASFPASSLCDADLPRGVGDKRALRTAARALGLRSCAGLAKRAIQFGSRVAKLSAAGSNRQTQGDAKFASLQ